MIRRLLKLASGTGKAPLVATGRLLAALQAEQGTEVCGRRRELTRAVQRPKRARAVARRGPHTGEPVPEAPILRGPLDRLLPGALRAAAGSLCSSASASCRRGTAAQGSIEMAARASSAASARSPSAAASRLARSLASLVSAIAPTPRHASPAPTTPAPSSSRAGLRRGPPGASAGPLSNAATIATGRNAPGISHVHSTAAAVMPQASTASSAATTAGSSPPPNGAGRR